MPATDNSAVQITINVVDGNSGQVINNVVKNLDSMGNAGGGAGKKLKQGLDEAGTAGVNAGKKVAAGMDEAAAHTLRPIDNVRLFRDDLGIKIPRAMEMVIAKSTLLSGILGAVGAGFVALGAAEILIRVGQQVYELYERWLDVDAVTQKYLDKVRESQELKFINPGNVNDAISHLQQINSQIDVLNEKRKTGGLLGPLVGNFDLYTTKDEERRTNLMGQRDTLQENLPGYEEKGIETGIEQMKSFAQATQGANQQLKTLYDLQLDLNRQKLLHGGYGDGTAADRNFDDANTAARVEYEGKVSAQNRKERDERIAAQEQAILSGLDGEAKYAAERQQAIDAVTRKFKDGEIAKQTALAETDAIGTRFENDRLTRIAQQNAEAQKMLEAARSAGLHGLAQNDATHYARIDEINTNRNLDPDAAATQRQAAAITAGQKEVDLQQEFSERLSQIDASHSDRFESENQRIQSAANRTTAEIMKAWKETYGQLDALDQRRVQSFSAVQAEIVKIQQDADRQKMEASQRVEDQTRTLEEEGARAGMTKEHEKTQQILDEYNDRYRHLEELRISDADNADKYRRQEIAAEEIKNGKLVEQQRELRDKLAGQIRGYFTHPLDELKKQGEEAAAKIAASFILKASPNAAGTVGAGGKRGGLFPDWTDVGGVFSRKGQTNAPSHPDAGQHASISAATSTMNATNAVINIQNASFAGVGGGSRSSAAAGGFNFPGLGSGGDSGGPGDFSIGGGSTSSAGDFGGAGAITGAASSVGLSGGGAAGTSAVGGALSAIPGLAGSANELGKDFGAEGDVTNKIPGVKGLTDKLGGSEKLGGIAGGALGLFGAFEGGGGFGGGLQGALGGAKIGAEFGGPAGAAIGAAAGAIIGLIGFGGRQKAEKYDKYTLRPQIAQEFLGYQSGAIDYATAYSDFDKMGLDAKETVKQYGSSGLSYYNDTIATEIRNTQARLTREQKAGRSEFGFTAAQFHGGGRITDFGSFATSSTEGFIHALADETVMNKNASMRHPQLIDSLNNGASASDIAAMYGPKQAPAASSGGTTNLHFHSHDAKGAYNLFMDNKHHIRAALNDSYAENSGGADFA